MQTSRPWTGVVTGDCVPYSAEQWADIYKYLLHAARLNSGAIIDSGTAPATGLQVQATGPASASVDILPGSALVEGTFYYSDTTENLAVPANVSGNPRIDTVILRKDYAGQTVRLVLLNGTPAVTPAPPALTQTNNVTWEIPLADIAVADSFVSITDDDLTPRHEWANAADGVYLKDVLNNSGVTLETGDVVIWDTTADRAVTTTTQPGHPRAAGVWVGRTNNGDYGRIQRDGIGYIHVNGAYTRGAGLDTSATTKQAQGNTVNAYVGGSLGMLLESSSGAGLVLALIHVRPNIIQRLQYIYEAAATSAGPTYASGADRTVPFTTEVYDDGGYGSLAANQITLKAGTYWVAARISVEGGAAAPAAFRLKLYNTTAAAEILKGMNCGAWTNQPGLGLLQGTIQLTVDSVLELRIRTETTTTAAEDVNDGTSEIYAVLDLMRMN